MNKTFVPVAVAPGTVARFARAGSRTYHVTVVLPLSRWLQGENRMVLTTRRYSDHLCEGGTSFVVPSVAALDAGRIRARGARPVTHS